MPPFSLQLIPQVQQPAGLRLVYVRGDAPHVSMCFAVNLDGGTEVRRQGTTDGLNAKDGMIVIERGVKRSTEKGALYLGFLNDQGAFWGDEWEGCASKSFQVYAYLPEEMFDRVTEFVKGGSMPSVIVDIAENQGFSTAGDAMVWDNCARPKVKLESVRVDFAIQLGAGPVT